MHAKFMSPDLLDPELRDFSHWRIRTDLFVPTSDLQALLDNLTGGGYEAFEAPGFPGLSRVFVLATIERIEERDDGMLFGSISTSSVTAFVNNTTTDPDQAEFAVLALYTTDPDVFNDVFGSDVARDGEFRWTVKQSEGEVSVKIRVEGTDGFRFRVEATGDEVLGDRIDDDPAEFPGGGLRINTYLSDGPAGAHPLFFFGFRGDDIPVDSSEFSREVIRLPDGRLRVEMVEQILLRRSLEQVFKVVD